MNEFEVIQYRQISGLCMFLDTVEFRTPHFHRAWELLWLLDQPLSVTYRKQTFAMEPGQMILISPNDPHEFHKLDQGATFLCMQMSPELFPDLPPLSMEGYLLGQYFSPEEMAALRLGMQKAAGAYFRQEPHSSLYCVGLANLLMHRILTGVPSHVQTPEEAGLIRKRNARLERLIAFVDQNYMHKIRLSDFAAAEGCSMSYLSHFIRDTMNMTFQQYVNSVRFHRACQLIAAGELQMLEVCMEAGFSDYRYFSREFKNQYGMTPEKYRSQQQCRPEPAGEGGSLHSTERVFSLQESIKFMETYFGE